jgi:phosphate-selective porin OprO/OprP
MLRALLASAAGASCANAAEPTPAPAYAPTFAPVPALVAPPTEPGAVAIGVVQTGAVEFAASPYAPPADYARPAQSVVPVVSSPAAGLTEADVERIVAEQMARRAAETGPQAEFASSTLLQSPKSDGPAPAVVGDDKSMSAKWNNGLEVQSKNKEFKIHVGGRTQFDTSFFQDDDHLEASSAAGGIGPLQDSMQFRRARLRVDGTLYEQISFAAEYEFLNQISVVNGSNTAATVATGVPAATDLWVDFTQLPLFDSIRVGNQKDPLGFEHIQSSRFLDFIERSFNQDLFYGPFNNGFSPGIVGTKYFWDKRASFAGGAFAANMNAGTNIYGYGIGNDYMYVTRATLLPIYDAEGRYLVHLGASYEYRNSDDGHVRVRTRGNVRNGPPGPLNSVYADTTFLQASNQDLLNLEFATVMGPWSLHSEYCFSNIYDARQIFGVPAPVNRGDVFVHGGYVALMYFLTGEHRNYSLERQSFDRQSPYTNSFRLIGNNGRIIQGWGAWQVGVRFDHADLDNSGINGGTLNGCTLGLNWFMNPNMKLQWNWDWTHRGEVTGFAGGAVTTVAPGDVFGFGTRLAIDF